MFLPQLGIFFITKEQEDKVKHISLLLYKASKQTQRLASSQNTNKMKHLMFIHCRNTDGPWGR